MFTTTTDLAQIIQVAVTPVFLLAGIAGFLSVMSTRLARIIDRSRIVDQRISTFTDLEKKSISCKELTILVSRTKLINRSIGLCTSSALMVCLVIVCLFSAVILKLEMTMVIATFFVISMLLLIAALICFLQEVRLGTYTLKVAKEFAVDDS